MQTQKQPNFRLIPTPKANTNLQTQKPNNSKQHSENPKTKFKTAKSNPHQNIKQPPQIANKTTKPTAK